MPTLCLDSTSISPARCPAIGPSALSHTTFGHHELVAYHQHVHRELTPHRLRFTVKRKDGRSVRVETQTVPFSYDGQLFAYAFVRELPVTASIARRRPRATAKTTTR